MISSIATLLEVADAITKIAALFRKGADEQKKQFAGLLKKIGAVLQHTAASLHADQIPHGDCIKLAVYAEEFERLAVPVLGKDQGFLYAEKLRYARDVELLWSELNMVEPDVKNSNIIALNQIGGTFEATGDLLLVMT